MKRKTAKELLDESFRELSEKKSIDKITIQEITDNCGYSPATFYRNFRDKYDLIAWGYTRDVAGIMDWLDGKNYQWKQTLLDGANHFLEERDYLANLLKHTSGQESFIRYMVEINYEALKKYILKASGKNRLDKKDELYVRIYCLGTVSLTCEWILGRHEASPEEIAEIYEHSLPAPLQKYVL
ncbi:MAG: TetR/AcrR family transcriptional regulator C-terminal domain-containing protein [Lachnospiraceae bacterium]|nr:TetR/AcrR family transcriptional regulator C-terminal domain-containing protein [Lachnospiraceae bacterium]